MSRSRQEGARERLVYHVHELERLEEAKAAAAARLHDAFSAAAAVGFDTPTLKAVLKLRKLSPEQRKERRALEAIYLAALGMLEGDPLPDEARRRLDEQDRQPQPERGPGPQSGPKAGPKEAKAPDPAAAPPLPPPPPQMPMNLKDPEEARQEGRDAAAAGKRIYDNPFPAGDPCRAAWDEGWCEQRKSHGMDTPAAYQRRTKPPDRSDKDAGAGDGEKKGAA